MQKWLLNLIIVGASFIGIQMISGELEQTFYFEDVSSPQSETRTKMENEQKLPERASENSSPSPQVQEKTGVKTQLKNDTMLSTLNALDLNGLQTLKGVGPVTAQRILDYKSSKGAFKSIEELLEIKGIGPKKLESIKASLGLMQK